LTVVSDLPDTHLTDTHLTDTHIVIY